jgi:EAL domain-containing protein (putative c-di-GMP-specific phosphodiesterase class I)
MGKTLSLTVVADGVETPEQQAFLSERRHCDETQAITAARLSPHRILARVLAEVGLSRYRNF